jgi:hypothetical protein
VDTDRERARELSRRLLRLHRVLLQWERRAYEDRHGSILSGELFHLLVTDRQFAWLRSLSAMVARIDELVDGDGPIDVRDVATAFQEAYRLLRSGEGGEFQGRYHEALQDSPDVVMAHADVSKLLPAARGDAPGR